MSSYQISNTHSRSIAIDRPATSEDEFCLAYFYCARNSGEPERLDPESILRSIARQLSGANLDAGRILNPVAGLNEERKSKSFANGQLRLKESIDLIAKLTGFYSITTIVIDALDECDPMTRHRLLSGFTKIVQKAAGLVKILVSSCDENDIVPRLQNLPNLYIKASHNSRDIQKYVEHEVRQAIAEARLLAGKVSPELADDIVGTHAWRKGDVSSSKPRD